MFEWKHKKFSYNIFRFFYKIKKNERKSLSKHNYACVFNYVYVVVCKTKKIQQQRENVKMSFAKREGYNVVEDLYFIIIFFKYRKNTRMENSNNRAYKNNNSNFKY